jgi:SAM-dependent MidA family methyltransferase
LDALIDVIRERGPMTVAAFMNLVLYDPRFGYYSRASRRSGRTGDFFTSVDVGSLFGELLAVQIAEMADIVARPGPPTAGGPFDLVEAGAGDGRLAADILHALRARHPDVFVRTRLRLVEASPFARDAQRSTLGELAGQLVSSDAELPSSFEGVLLANELLDAMPVHQVVMRDGGLRETYVSASERSRLVLVEGAPSTPALAGYLDEIDVSLEPGWRVEINLSAVDWVRRAARRIRRGFILLIDYGHEARELYSVTHAAGTLSAFSRHTASGAESAAEAGWLTRPGEQDITAHVDFTSIRAAAEEEGLATIAFLDQTYFLLGLASAVPDLLDSANRRRGLTTLVMPGGLGSTMKVLILGKGVGTPALRGLSFGTRAT